jgi:MFS transporter, DHA2 family, methylenomycin A resistance protein
MSTAVQAADRAHSPARADGPTGSRYSLGAALLGFFVITLDALIVSVALPSIGKDLGGGIAGLQWVVDGSAIGLRPGRSR